MKQMLSRQVVLGSKVVPRGTTEKRGYQVQYRPLKWVSGPGIQAVGHVSDAIAARLPPEPDTVPTGQPTLPWLSISIAIPCTVRNYIKHSDGIKDSISSISCTRPYSIDARCFAAASSVDELASRPSNPL